MSHVRAHLQAILSDKFGRPVAIEFVSVIGGGCINETARVKTSEGVFFAKWNDARRFPHMLALEAKGLQLLKGAGTIKVPDVIAEMTKDNTQYLVLEYITPLALGRESGSEIFWHTFGAQLARMHKHSSKTFGLDHNNYIGSLPQSNNHHSAWSDFFILGRLEPQIKLALDAKRIGSEMVKLFNRLFQRIENIFPPEPPALLHGDLWSGNYMRGKAGEPVLIDPAVYFGHREMDLAMTKLFGGFENEFYQSYQEEFPMEKDWQQRADICNLYPLLVHVNLFGGSYASQISIILSRF